MTAPHDNKLYGQAIPKMIADARETHPGAIVIFEHPYLVNEIMLFVYGQDAEMLSAMLDTQLNKGDDIPLEQYTCFPSFSATIVHSLAQLLGRPVYQYEPPNIKTSKRFSLN